MDASDPRTDAVRQAMEAVPVSRRELARRAGLAHTTLNRIAQREGRASREVAKAVAAALADVSTAAGDARDAVLAALDRGPHEEA